MSSHDPIPDLTTEADEADIAEQRQDLDGSGSLTPPVVGLGEASEADALDQGADITSGISEPGPPPAEADEADALEQRTAAAGDDDGYPHSSERGEDD